MGDRQIDDGELDRFLNDLAAGQAAAEHYDLESEVIDLMRIIHGWADTPLPAPAHDRIGPAVRAEIERIESSPGGREAAAPLRHLVGDWQSVVPNGHAGPSVRRRPFVAIPAGGQRRRWAFSQLATAAMLLITLGSVYLAFLHPRTGDDGPNVEPPFASAVTETLLDTTVEAVPTGHSAVAVILWRFRPGPASLTGGPYDGPTFVVVDAGSLVVTVGGTDHVLAAGDSLVVPPRQEHSLRNADAVDALVLIVHLVPIGGDSWWQPGGYDPLSVTRVWPIDSTSDVLPSGPARLSLERMTLSPGEALPPYETSQLEWIGIVSGRLGLALTGDRLPFRWESGQEQLFVGEQWLPKLQDGWQMTLRNAGDDPLVLVRLRITPAGDSRTPTVQTSPSAGD